MRLINSIQGSKLFIRSIVIIFLSLFILLLQGCGQMQTADLQNLTLPTTPNYYLICPKGFCNVEPNEYSPLYTLSAEDLFNAWNQLVVTQPFMNITGTIPDKAQYEYVQKSFVFGFPTILQCNSLLFQIIHPLWQFIVVHDMDFMILASIKNEYKIG